MVGALTGVILLALVQNILILSQIQTFWIDAANGLVILIERKPEARYVEMMKKQLDFCEQIVTSFVRFAEEGRAMRRSMSP